MSKFDRSLAIVIGINDYQNGIDKLQNAIPDAIAITEILQNNYKYELAHPDFEKEVIVNRYATKDELKTILPNKIKPTYKNPLSSSSSILTRCKQIIQV